MRKLLKLQEFILQRRERERERDVPLQTSTSSGNTIDGWLGWLVLILINAVWLSTSCPKNFTRAMVFVSNGRIS